MDWIRYTSPSSLVVELGLNLDTLVYFLLWTIFHPIFTWIFVYFQVLSFKLAIITDLLWICRFFSLQYNFQNVKFKNQVVLITGGSDGLGFQMVKKFTKCNDIKKVIVIDIKSHIEFENMEKVQFFKFDLNDDLEKLIGKLNLQEIDVLICNAGMRQLNAINALNHIEIKKVINVNWISHLLLIKKYLAKRNGHIIVVGSVLGFVGPKNLGIYAGTKNALLSMIYSLNEEYKNSIFSIILPGQLNSQLFSDIQVNGFLAPVIDVIKLAQRIVDITNLRLNGTFAFPLYGRFLPVYMILPYSLQRFCRWYSGMDNV
jgi:short-subunit dehydrogenase